MRLFIYLVISCLFLQFAFSQEFQTSNSVYPNRQQEAFRVGGRIQRVRFFLSNPAHIDGALKNSEQFNIIKGDSAIPHNGPTTYYGAPANAPTQMGFAIFAEESATYGIVVNFPLISCAAKVVDLIKSIGDTRSEEFEMFKIDEINVFLKPVAAVAGSNYKLSLSPVTSMPNDPALNVQIPIVIPGAKCMLPSRDKLEIAFKNAICMGGRMSYCK